MAERPVQVADAARADLGKVGQDVGLGLRYAQGLAVAEVAVGSDLRLRVLTEGATPVISSPTINFSKIKDPSILDVF